jgi:GTP cyclohydrolase IA
MNSFYPKFTDSINDEDKIAIIEENFKQIMETLGLDLTDDSLIDTPHRVAKMYVKEVFSGLDDKNFPKITLFKNPTNDGQVITVDNITVNSFCEHHFVPMIGMASVSYIPKDNIIGLSKINRIVEYFARRPQVQERLTSQVADCLCDILNIEDVEVSLTLTHFCVTVRGVRDSNSTTTTQTKRGLFQK